MESLGSHQGSIHGQLCLRVIRAMFLQIVQTLAVDSSRRLVALICFCIRFAQGKLASDRSSKRAIERAIEWSSERASDRAMNGWGARKCIIVARALQVHLTRWLFRFAAFFKNNNLKVVPMLNCATNELNMKSYNLCNPQSFLCEQNLNVKSSFGVLDGL